MTEIKKVLFPVDLSGVSAKIAPRAVAVVQRFNAEVHLLLVVESLKNFTAFYVPHPSLDTFDTQMIKDAERKLQAFEEEFFQDVQKVKRVIMRGDPAEEILKYTEAEKVDLVIMGTHGRKGLDRALFGSVADQVVKNSPAPVMSINPYRRD